MHLHAIHPRETNGGLAHRGLLTQAHTCTHTFVHAHLHIHTHSYTHATPSQLNDIRVLHGAVRPCAQDVNKEDWDAVNAWMDAAVAGLGHLDLQPVGEGAAAAAGSL